MVDQPIRREFISAMHQLDATSSVQTSQITILSKLFSVDSMQNESTKQRVKNRLRNDLEVYNELYVHCCRACVAVCVSAAVLTRRFLQVLFPTQEAKAANLHQCVGGHPERSHSRGMDGCCTMHYTVASCSSGDNTVVTALARSLCACAQPPGRCCSCAVLASALVPAQAIQRHLWCPAQCYSVWCCQWRHHSHPQLFVPKVSTPTRAGCLS